MQINYSDMNNLSSLGQQTQVVFEKKDMNILSVALILALLIDVVHQFLPFDFQKQLVHLSLSCIIMLAVAI